MTKAVEDVLEELGVASPRTLVLNKADLLDDERRRELSFRHPEAVLVSAASGEGLEDLRERVLVEFERTLSDVELLVPFSQGALLNELHELAGEMEREDTPEGVGHTRIPTVVGRGLGRYAVNGRSVPKRFRTS